MTLALTNRRKRRREAFQSACSVYDDDEDAGKIANASRQTAQRGSAGLGDATSVVPSFDSLPDEVVLHVLVALGGPRALCMWAQTSRRHARLARDDSLWRPLCESRFGPLLHREHAKWAKDWHWLYRAQAHVGTAAGRDVGAASVNIDGCNKYVYWGDLKDGRPHGYGLAIQWPTRHCQKGSLVRTNDRSAMSTPPKRAVYEGQWRRGWMHGHGVYLFKNGGHYRGEWRDDERHGYGADVTPNGDRYTGEWTRGKRHGYGVWTAGQSDESYQGQWTDNVAHGFGVYTHADGTCYRGDNRHGVRDGYGEYTCSDGDRYNCWWHDDEPHGPGVIVRGDGTYLRGEWLHGKNHGPFVLHAPDGSYYQGECQDDLRHGHGIWIEANGSRYDGQWVRDKRDGEGTWDYPDGSRAHGRWTHEGIVSGHVVWHHGHATSCFSRLPCMACTVVGSKASV
ncbi:Morn repeat domain containing protein [Pandoravirus salinus]|uniref:Morn repeat domain containing protein n=1 Tax=Pandoravirus salinus TaxID=1349410 RepID=S4VWV5_9VIRU|nr:morn repeat domain [Pandoravirus salinus]AGO84858.1 Morn repeat domain containing protein [Pandoravirus salinus]